MAKNTVRVFDGKSEIHNDSVGNQWIDVGDLAGDEKVKTDLQRLNDGFRAEQEYRQSLKSGDAQPSLVEEAATVTEERSHHRESENKESRREEPKQRFRENESS